MTGLKIKELLAARKVNVADLGRYCGLTRQNVTKKLESDREDVPFNRQVAKYLGIPFRTLIPDEEEEQINGLLMEPETGYGKLKVDLFGEMKKILNDNTTLVRIIEERNNLIIKLIEENE